MKKATIIRCYLAEHDKSMENSLNWLSPIIDAFVQVKSEHNYFFRNLIRVLHIFSNSAKACEWILELIGQMQSLVTDDDQHDIEKCMFLCDIFIIGVIIFSGVGNLFGNLDEIALSRQNR